MTVKISPSILSSDFSRLGEEVRAMNEAGCDYIHIDVMDGHFAPNLTFGPPVIKCIRHCTDKVFDVHLMITPAQPFLQDYADAGADIITVHAEAGQIVRLDYDVSRSPAEVIEQIEQQGGDLLLPPVEPVEPIK